MPAVDKHGRLGLTVVAQMAEDEMNRHASTNLCPEDLKLIRDFSGAIFHHSPQSDWKALVGIEPDKDNWIEVGLGVADPGAYPHKPVRVVALALASRRPDNPVIRVVWYPKK